MERLLAKTARSFNEFEPVFGASEVNELFRNIKAEVLKNYVSKAMDKSGIQHLDPKNEYHLALIHMNKEASGLTKDT